MTDHQHTSPRLTFGIEHAVIGVLSIAASAWWLFAASRVTSPGFPLDDAWIHLQFARNLAEGYGMSFNPGVPSSGSTAPLWTLCLAPLLALGIPPVYAGLSLGIVLTVASAVAAVEFTRLATGSRMTAAFAGASVAVAGRVVWAAVSGMEGPLFTFLTLAALIAYVLALSSPRTSWGAWGLLAGLTGTARPEAFVIVAVLAAHWSIGPGSESRRADRRSFVLPLALFGAVALAYVALNYHAGGHPLPMTFYAKSRGEGLWHAMAALDRSAIARTWAEPLVALNKVLLFCMNQSALLFAALIVGLLTLMGVFHQPALRPGAGLAAAVFLVSPLLKGLIAPNPSILVHNGRYVTHLTVLFLIASAIGLLMLHRHSRHKWVVSLVALLALARVGSVSHTESRVYAQWVKNINDLQVATGRWLHTHTSEDAIVATNDIGAIAYFSRRTVVDLDGLVTPEAIPFRRAQNTTGLLRQTRPDVLVMFPEWYPDVMASGLAREQYRVSAKKVVAAGPALVFYTLPWTREGRVWVGASPSAGANSSASTPPR